MTTIRSSDWRTIYGMMVNFYTRIQQNKRAMLLHDTWGRRSTNKRRENKRAVSPSTTHIRLYIFVFFYFRGGRRNRRKQHEEDMKELCPNTTHGEEAQTDSLYWNWIGGIWGEYISDQYLYYTSHITRGLLLIVF